MAHDNLGVVLAQKGQLDEAIREFREAIRLKPNLPRAHNNLGMALLDEGQLDESIAAHREAIRLQADYAEAHCYLGEALQRKGRFAEALAAVRRGHELGSRNPHWQYLSAQWVRQNERLVELDGRLSAVLGGQDQPSGVVERLEFARVCTLKGLHAAATRLYGENFAAEPRLTYNMTAAHRYNAARAAAQAGCGQGEDATKLDDKERAHSRQRALDWLRADLAFRISLAEKDAKARSLLPKWLRQ
jgi:tetratricopeptide (TPR) repeat protein